MIETGRRIRGEFLHLGAFGVVGACDRAQELPRCPALLRPSPAPIRPPLRERSPLAYSPLFTRSDLNSVLKACTTASKLSDRGLVPYASPNSSRSTRLNG